MAHSLNASVAKLVDLSSFPETHTWKGKNDSCKLSLTSPAHIYTQNNHIKNKVSRM